MSDGLDGYVYGKGTTSEFVYLSHNLVLKIEVLCT